MLSLDVANWGGFDDYGYNYGVGVVDEDGLFGWGGVICVCERCVDNVLNLSKVMVCGDLDESLISVAISESFVFGGIGRYWDGT